MKLRVVIVLAITAAAVRLVPLQWLHPLNWDELEFFRATLWIAEGRVPFRDFWEHHTPLTWFVFAPFAAMTGGAGVSSVIAMRWTQIPVWIGIFTLINVWMRRAGIDAFPRWTAMAIALASSLLMIPAVEFRIDPLAILLYVAGLVLAQRGTRRASFFAGFVFCLSAFANLRMGPLLVVTVVLLWLAVGRVRVHTWIPAGGFAALALCLAYFAATGSVDELWTHAVVDNYLGDKLSRGAGPMFVHRILLPFGVRILGQGSWFDAALIDVGGAAVIVLTIAGFAFVARRLRERGDLLVIAVAAAANLLFIAAMKFVYVYHFMIAVVLAVPLLAVAIARMPWRAAVAVAAAAWCVNLYGSLFRGKELDLAYQQRIMTEVVARTAPHERVWSGGAWAIRRDPAYRLFFVHEIARVLVAVGRLEPYRVDGDPPAAVVFDYNAYLWLMLTQPELAPYFVRHYTPLWRNLWIPAPNARIRPGAVQAWVVPRDGAYRIYASEAIASHPWFSAPLPISAIEQRHSARLPIRLPERGVAHPALRWSVDGRPLNAGPVLTLRKGQRLAAMNSGTRPVAVFLLPGNDRVIFRQPPPGVTLEASSPRETHLPRFGVRIE